MAITWIGFLVSFHDEDVSLSFQYSGLMGLGQSGNLLNNKLGTKRGGNIKKKKLVIFALFCQHESWKPGPPPPFPRYARSSWPAAAAGPCMPVQNIRQVLDCRRLLFVIGMSSFLRHCIVVFSWLRTYVLTVCHNGGWLKTGQAIINNSSSDRWRDFKTPVRNNTVSGSGQGNG
jgi:hypothetical protein